MHTVLLLTMVGVRGEVVCVQGVCVQSGVSRGDVYPPPDPDAHPLWTDRHLWKY